MKKITSLKIAGAVIATAFAALAARADLAINENVSLSGYAAGSFSYNKAQKVATDIGADLDAAKIAVDLNFAPIAAKVSLYTDNGDDRKLYLLDAYVTYSFNDRLSVTGGRFLTWLGYDAFDIPETGFISYALDWGSVNNGMGVVPDYHEGFRLDYQNGKAQLGLAVVDSIYSNGTDLYRGDGKVNDGIGIEAHFEYTELNWSLGVTVAHQEGKSGKNNPDIYANDERFSIANIWLERTFDDLTVAGEVFFQRYDANNFASPQTNFYAQGSIKQQVNEKLAIAGRFSYGNQDNFGNYWKFSVVPASYELTNNLAVRSEVSYTRYNENVQAAGNPKYEVVASVQAIFKF